MKAFGIEFFALQGNPQKGDHHRHHQGSGDIRIADSGPAGHHTPDKSTDRYRSVGYEQKAGEDASENMIRHGRLTV